MMEGNRRTLALVAVAVAIGVLYFITTQLLSEPEGEAEQADATPAATEGADPGATPAGAHSPERLAQRRTATITTDSFVATVDNLSGGLAHVALTGDPRFTGEDGRPLDAITTRTDEMPEYAAFRVDLARIGIPESAIWELTQVSPAVVRLRWEGEGIRVTRTLSAGRGPYQIWSTTRIQNLLDRERRTRLELSSYHYVTRESEAGGFIGSRSSYISSGVCVYDDETERKDHETLVDDGAHGYGADDVHLAALENVYFVGAMAAHGEPAARCGLSAEDRFQPGNDEPDGSLFRAQLTYPWVTIPANGEQRYRTLGYFGPKDPGPLHLAGHRLPEMVDLGFFSLIAQQLARLLGVIHGVVPNWGLAIILLTILIRLALFPLTNLSFNSMSRMRLLKPEIDRINELYKDEAEKKGAAVMELYRKHKINPLSGCLPSLAQLPVWWALYTSLSTNIALYHMPFALWWTDLSSPDPYYVLPVLLGALMHLQQRLSPTTMDPAQAKMMMWFMPIMITVFMLFLPSGLCLYMLTNSALGIGQQKLNEVRMAKQAPLAASAQGSDDGEGEDDADEGDDDVDDASGKPQVRRPRRKRRVRSGRA